MSDDAQPRKLPIAIFDGKAVLPRAGAIATIGDCLDHGRVLHVRCACNPRIVELRPERLLALKDGPSEETRLADLRPWLRCKKCGRCDCVTARAMTFWRGDTIPRIAPPPKQYGPVSDRVPAGGIDYSFEPVPDPHPRPKGRKRVFKA
ncbi:hypothetical protein [Parvibaculum sp.]|uniref:hypothetical protein n=1 Tax=Parvibaculum sp. TaxID=2024848 RepID=UPI002731B2C4|nr:hypothetical protein [Parvibaculum sp.]MDP1628880.1 hypothetical protein [Parvibaculum sp.]MDP2148275.1 hypothetical protein [Parvibaculum sp.]MDP3327728.1 hypothetical protein [Parvibaculum sp.]